MVNEIHCPVRIQGHPIRINELPTPPLSAIIRCHYAKKQAATTIEDDLRKRWKVTPGIT
jgi:hypothetical protein